jgi:hypothetical protein
LIYWTNASTNAKAKLLTHHVFDHDTTIIIIAIVIIITIIATIIATIIVIIAIIIIVIIVIITKGPGLPRYALVNCCETVNFLDENRLSSSLSQGFFGVLQGDFNWMPDAEHADGAAAALQWMLLQSDGERILLWPAWPQAWQDADFSLRAWHNTTVSASCRNGQTVSLEVDPPHRRKDVVFVGSACLPTAGLLSQLAE